MCCACSRIRGHFLRSYKVVHGGFGWIDFTLSENLCFNSIQRTVRREFIFLIVILYRFVILIYDVSIVRSEKRFR